MFIRKIYITIALLLMTLPFTAHTGFASSSIPTKLSAYEESYYFSHNGVESQATGSLITSNEGIFLPLTDVAQFFQLSLEKQSGDLYLNGNPVPNKSSEVSGSLAKDRTIADQFMINPVIGATAGIVLEDGDPNPIYIKNGNHSLYPSSTTKVMTALLAIEQGNLKDVVVIGANAEKVPSDSSKAGILPGERLTLEQLLYALMLPSGNDAAVAIAEHISGSEQKFVQLMNKRAKELGVTRTNFTNSHGYHHSNHYTTANDLAKIASEAAKHPEFMKVISIPTYYTTYIGTNGLPKTKIWKNTNTLIQKDSPYFTSTVIGGKTGYTSASRYNLVSFAENNGHSYITVLLKGERNQRFVDTRNLLQAAYSKRATLKSSKVNMNVTTFSGKLIVNGSDYTDELPIFIRNGTIYVSTHILQLIYPNISYVKRSDNQQIKAAFNANLLTFDLVEPTLKDGRMLVPLRTFFEEAGLKLTWDQKAQTIEGVSENTHIKMTIDSKHASVNGQAVILDVAATVQNGRTLVPLRFVSESTGASVDWGRGRTLYLY